MYGAMNSYGKIFLPCSVFLPNEFRVDFSMFILFLFFIIYYYFLNVDLTLSLFYECKREKYVFSLKKVCLIFYCKLQQQDPY